MYFPLAQISAYLLHSGFKRTAQSALAYFGDSRTANAQGVTIPSQMRWVHYFEHTLRHGAAPPQTFNLLFIRVLTVPSVDSIKGSCAPYVTVDVDAKQVLDSRDYLPGGKLRKYRKSEPFMDIDCSVASCTLHSNVKLVLWHDRLPVPLLLGSVWFHANYVSQSFLSFNKHNIDVACKDKSHRFDDDFGIEVYMERVVTARSKK
jgi:phosphatidylinositol-3,4,5-trisphosphate 3-phosphatase/dual-specificity protein phosphatase PTEN